MNILTVKIKFRIYFKHFTKRIFYLCSLKDYLVTQLFCDRVTVVEFVVIPLLEQFIDGKSSEKTTESVNSRSFNTIGVASPDCWLFKDSIILDKPEFPTPKEFPFGLASF